MSTGAFRCPTPYLCANICPPILSFQQGLAFHLLPASPQPPRNMVPLLSVVTTGHTLLTVPVWTLHAIPQSRHAKTRRAPCCTGLAQWASPRCQGLCSHSVSQGVQPRAPEGTQRGLRTRPEGMDLIDASLSWLGCCPGEPVLSQSTWALR